MTAGLEGRCSIQLSYGRMRKESGRQDLNLRHLAPKASALPDCATPRDESTILINNLTPLGNPPWQISLR